MRVALVHDYLNQFGGAERVLETLAEIFPDAPIYTLLYDEDKTFGHFKGRVATTSFLDTPLARKNHRAFIPVLPIAASAMKIGGDYDLVISSSAGFAKGVRLPQNTPHLSYCHTPLRYAWEPNYLNAVLPKPAAWLAKPALALMRAWDYRAGKKPDLLLANSRFIADKIKSCYNRPARVVHPPVDLSVFYPEKIKGGRSYFLALGRFLHYKKFDLIIDAFKKNGLPLRIAGSGPEEERLKAQAQGAANIEFRAFESDPDRLRALYGGARALIFPQVEDFGLVAAEAIACGTPVIAYNAGGAREIVGSGSGMLFDEQTSEEIGKAVERFVVEEKKFTPGRVSKGAAAFSKERFKEAILTAAEEVQSWKSFPRQEVA